MKSALVAVAVMALQARAQDASWQKHLKPSPAFGSAAAKSKPAAFVPLRQAPGATKKPGKPAVVAAPAHPKPNKKPAAVSKTGTRGGRFESR